MKVHGRSDTHEVWDLYPTFSGSLAFDVGANGGTVSLVLAENFTKVIALEPAEESFQDLEALRLPNVVCSQVAVSDQDGSVILQEAESATHQMGELVTGIADSPLAWVWGEECGQRQVAAVTLDTLARLYGIPDFIKIDVEGHEAHVISGGLTMLSEHDPILLIEVHAASLGEGIRSMLPDYHWTRYDHAYYVGNNSPLVNEHYWLRGEK